MFQSVIYWFQRLPAPQKKLSWYQAVQYSKRSKLKEYKDWARNLYSAKHHGSAKFSIQRSEYRVYRKSTYHLAAVAMISNTRRDTVRTSVITTVRDSLRLLKITHFALLPMINNSLKLITLTNISGSLSPIDQVSSPCCLQKMYQKSTRGTVLTRRLPSQ